MYVTHSPQHIPLSLLYRLPNDDIFPLPITPCVYVCQPANNMPASSPLANHSHSHCRFLTAHILPLMNITPLPLAFTIQSTFGSGNANSFNFNKKSHFTTVFMGFVQKPQCFSQDFHETPRDVIDFCKTSIIFTVFTRPYGFLQIFTKALWYLQCFYKNATVFT